MKSKPPEAITQTWLPSQTGAIAESTTPRSSSVRATNRCKTPTPKSNPSSTTKVASITQMIANQTVAIDRTLYHGAGTGPRAISLLTWRTKSIPRSRYRPTNPVVVKTTSPGFTRLEPAAAVRINPCMIQGCRHSSADHPAVVAI